MRNKENVAEHTFKIGSYVRQWRSLKGIKQSYLATQLQLSNAALSNIENDLTIPNLRQVENIARHLDISIDMLLHGPEVIVNRYRIQTGL